MRRIGLLVAACAVAGSVAAQDAPVARMMSDAEALPWRAVGRLNVAGNRSCTATLISDRLVLTAAHCLFSPLTGRQSLPSGMTFVAGQHRDTYAALRKVAKAVTLPGFERGGLVRDVALLELESAIPAADVTPVVVADWSAGEKVAIIAYGQDRAYMPSIREGCTAELVWDRGTILSCDVVPGVSGAPVVTAGGQVVAVVSAKIGQGPGAGPAVVVLVAPVIEALRAQLK